MKVAVLSESSADERGVRILVDAVLGLATEHIEGPALRSRGWPSVLQVAPAALKHLHYQTAADGFVVVVDSNGCPHAGPPGSICDATDKCRLCKLRGTIEAAAKQLRPVVARPPVMIAVGLAVPAVEGWYRCGTDPRVTESAWIQGLASRSLPYDKRQLKRDVYGTDRPGLELETRRAEEEAHRLARALPTLERLFPSGFGALAAALRTWQRR